MQNKIINGYTLKTKLGEGGMAEVWQAENKLGKKAAIKILLPALALMPEVVARFENEAKVMVTLQHINIRQVYDFDSIDNRPCIIMEMLEGSDLSTLLKKGKRFTDKQLIIWWNQLVDALNYTHKMGVVHRDIKPSNIFLIADENIKLLDFGISKVRDSVLVTKTGSRMGTLQYMSPEQVKDSKYLDYRSDIYSITVTFYHLLTGKSPYDNTKSSDFEILTKIVTEPLEMEKLPNEWQFFLQPYLNKKASQRPPLTHYCINPITEEKHIPPTPPQIESDITIVDHQPVDPLNPDPVKPQPKKNAKKYLFLGIGIVAVLLVLFSWYFPFDRNHFGHYQNIYGKVALISDETNKRITGYKYDDAEYFNEGLAKASYNNKYGFVDNTDNKVIPFKYDYAASFTEGMACVGINDRYGLIDKTGKEVIPIVYDRPIFFNEEHANVCLNGKWGYIDKTGNVVIPINYDNAGDFSEGLAYVSLNYKYGFIDKTGSEVIPFNYDWAYDFSEGLACITLNGKYGFIDRTGNEVIPIEYEDANSFGDGLALVKKNDKQFFINKIGEYVKD